MLIDDLKNVVKGEVSDAEADLKKDSEDASIFILKPKVVVRPEDAKDVQALVKYAAAHKKEDASLSITARSAGTDMSGGPLNDSIIMEMIPHFNHILEVGEGFAVTEPGVYYRDFEKETMKTGQIMPSYPASRELCSVGGMVSNNSGGEKSLSYGKTEDYVMELDVVLSDGSTATIKPIGPEELKAKMREETLEGRIYKGIYDLIEANYDAIHAAKPNVSKNSAGYYLWNVWDRKTFNLQKLIVGSQGTLAMVTKIKYRLVKKHTHSELLVMFLDDLDKLGDIVDTVAPYKPETFESYDDNTFKLAIKFFPDLLKRMKGNLFMLGLQFLPEIWLTLTGGVPKLVLIAEFTAEDEASIKTKMDTVKKVVEDKFHIKTHETRNLKETMKYWVMRRESFNLLRQHVQGMHTAPFIDDIVVRPHDLPTFLPRLNQILDPYKSKIIYTIAGHAGDGNFHIIPLMDFKKPDQRGIILELSDKVYNLVAEYKGTITGEHNDGIIRTPYLPKIYSPLIIDLFKKTKEIFDPQYIFNPHKKVNGDLSAIVKYMKQN